MKYQSIGLIGAMDEEIERFAQHMEGAKETVKAGIRFAQGEWNGKQITLCKCGVGKVNAAICTQILIDTFGVDAVIFTGVAGAVHPELEIGDIVISAECQQHDMDATAIGYAKGEIPFGAASVFEADASLVEAAKRAAEGLYPGLTRLGRVLSGDQFISSREKVYELFTTFGALCVEMEGSAVAQVCHLNNIPYVVLRSMSDKADGSAHVNFREFTKLAAERSASIVERMLLGN